MAKPPVGPAAARLRGLHGVVVRPFQDGRGALVLGPAGAFVVDVDESPWALSDRQAEWAYRVEQALGRGPVQYRLVRSPADVDDLTGAIVDRDPHG